MMMEGNMITEKRFIPIFDGTDKRVVGAKDNGKIISFMDMFDLLNDLSDENEHYKSIFFELVETALTDMNCRELYCKGILDIFNKANSLNQAREMIKEHLE